MENGEGPVPRTTLLGVKGEAQAAAAPAEDRPFPAPPGPRTVMERPWERSPIPEGAPKGSPVPVAAGTRSGAASGGTGWQPRAGCRGTKGGAVAYDRGCSALWACSLRRPAPAPPPEL